MDVIPEFRLLPVMLMDGQITLAHFKQSRSAHTLLLLNPVNRQTNTTNWCFSHGQPTIRGMSSVSPLSRREGHPGGCLESRLLYTRLKAPYRVPLPSNQWTHRAHSLCCQLTMKKT